MSAWVVPTAVVVAASAYATLGLGPAILIIAGGVLLVIVTLLWTSIGRLTGEALLTLDEAIGLAAPSAEEERKRSILRALKDLEYERSVGKINAEDFKELSTKYRAEAKVLLQAIEATNAPKRELAEALLAERLKKEGVAGGGANPKRRQTSQSGAKAELVEPKELPSESLTCSACSASNDADARFCKHCGEALATKEPA